MAEPMIRVRDVTKTYRRGGETLTVLDRLELEMDEGRFSALMGRPARARRRCSI
jgi:ABC-type lipoprotein export system ATPase subunit